MLNMIAKPVSLQKIYNPFYTAIYEVVFLIEKPLDDFHPVRPISFLVK